MSAPDRIPGTRACVVVTHDGVKLCGNRAAFRSLARLMTWIAESDPAAHFECHAKWHLASDAFLQHKAAPNVATLFTPDMFDHFAPRSEDDPGFELTFRAVEEGDLDELLEHEPSGVLPEGWDRAEE
jgi:hypothetical protein